MSISEPKKRSDVTYIMVSAIFGFRKKAPSGRKKYVFSSDSGYIENRFGATYVSIWAVLRVRKTKDFLLFR